MGPGNRRRRLRRSTVPPTAVEPIQPRAPDLSYRSALAVARTRPRGRCQQSRRPTLGIEFLRRLLRPDLYPPLWVHRPLAVAGAGPGKRVELGSTHRKQSRGKSVRETGVRPASVETQPIRPSRRLAQQAQRISVRPSSNEGVDRPSWSIVPICEGLSTPSLSPVTVSRIAIWSLSPTYRRVPSLAA